MVRHTAGNTDDQALQLTTVIYNLYNKFGTSTRICAIAYGENADILNRATVKISFVRDTYLDKSIKYPIDTLLYLNSPIYEFSWRFGAGYISDFERRPTQYRNLFNIYTKGDGFRTGGILNPFYPDRKYRQKARLVKREDGSTLALIMPVKNIRALKINNANQLDDVSIDDLMSRPFVRQLAPLLAQAGRFQVNFDLIAQIFDEQRDTDEQPRPTIIINRFVQQDPSGDLIIKYGDSSSQEYVIATSKNVASLEHRLIKSFMREFYETQVSLAGLLMVPVLDTWVPRTLGNLNADFERIKRIICSSGNQ